MVGPMHEGLPFSSTRSVGAKIVLESKTTKCVDERLTSLSVVNDKINNLVVVQDL